MKKSFYYKILLHNTFKGLKLKSLISIFYVAPIIMLLVRYFDNVYLFSLLNSLSLQISIAFAVIGLILFLTDKRIASFINIISAVYIIISIHNFDSNFYNEKKSEHNISVSHFNVLKNNKNYDRLINSALVLNSDIISFQEISSDWKEKLVDSLSKKYPYNSIKEIDDDYFGIALFSKYKLYNKKLIYIEGVPNIFATIYKNGKTIDIVTVHTNSPINKTRFDKRNKHLTELTKCIKDTNKNILVIGDFNTVPWDSHLLKFKNSVNLKDSRKSYASTWPRAFGKFGIPLDYIFYSNSLQCISFNVITDSSSDHSGIKGVYNIN